MNKKRQFLQFVIPSIASMIVFSLYTMVDGIYVARFVGETALSAVNISLPYISFIFAFSILFSVGTSTVVAIYRGENNEQRGNEIFTINTIFLSITSIMITILAHSHIDELATFLGASKELMPAVKEYLQTIVWFTFFFIVAYSMEVLVKTDGHPKLATAAIVVGAITNIVMDFVLVVVFPFGLRGAAIATGLSQVVTFVVLFGHFFFKHSNIKLCKTSFDISIYKRIVPIGVADFITELSAGVIVFLFNHAILKYIGENGIVTYTIITYVYNLIMMTFTGISQGMQPLVSFYKGQKRSDICRTFLHYAIYSSFALSIVALGICLFGAPLIVSIFVDRSVVPLFQDSVDAMRIFSLCYLVIGYNIVFSGYFAAIEKSRYSFIISLLRGFVLIAASIVILGYLFEGDGIWYATLLCESITLLFSGSFMWKQREQSKLQG